jgi:prepilin-type N-terminal cleavage/methylation domain-containing protein
MLAIRRRIATLDRNDDRGTTLTELLVGMTLMAIFMTIFTTAVYQMSRTVNKVESATTSAGQANQAFLKLDKLVRYASAIATAGRSTGGSWYVELDNTANGPETCTQLRIDSSTQQLQQRTWTITNSVVSAASNWSMIADGVTNGSVASGAANQPFTVPSSAAAASSPFQQLTVTLLVTSNTGTTSTTRTNLTFTALNSVSSAATNSSTCQQKGRP